MSTKADLDIVKKQYAAACIDKPIDCAGGDCERKRVLIWMYRCFWCGKYYCPVCAKEHFGKWKGKEDYSI